MTKTYTATGYMNVTSAMYELGDITGPLPIYGTIEDYTKDNPGWEAADGSIDPVKVTLTFEHDAEEAMDKILTFHKKD